MDTSHEELLAQNQRLSQELKQRLFELSILYDISNSISYTLDYDELLRIMMEYLHKIVDYDVCASLLLKEENTAQLVIKITHPVDNEIIKKIKHDIIRSFSSLIQKEGIILKEDESVIIQDEIDNNIDLSCKAIRSSFDVPLFIRDKIVGVLSINSVKEIPYSDDDIKLLYTIAAQASGAIERLKALISAEKSKMNIMVEGMNEGVVMIDERDELIVCNPAARKMLGFGADMIESRDISNRLSQIGLDFNQPPQVKDLELDMPYFQIIHAEAVSVKDKEGKSLGRIVTLRDVTKERQLDKMKSDFVSIVSHELRTPLAAMSGATENLLDGIAGEVNSMQKECLSIIKRNIDRLSRLINDLLDISRMEAGMLEIVLKPCNIVTLIDDVLLLFSKQADEKRILLKKEVEDFLPDASADSDKITQVLANLVGNAMKFTPTGGNITIRTAKLDSRLLQVDVIDTGIGIAPLDLERVFDKFYQVGSINNPDAKGTGLGLTICKGIVERHGGKIWAESKPGKGSKFSFTLEIEHG